MEALGIGIQIVFIALIILVPIISVFKGYGFLRANMISIPFIFLVVVIGAYWPHFYADLRLELMGFDFEGMNDVERARNVALELRGEATKLYWSNMGIGWPLKAIFGMLFVALYPSTFWCVVAIVKYIKHRLRNEIT